MELGRCGNDKGTKGNDLDDTKTGQKRPTDQIKANRNQILTSNRHPSDLRTSSYFLKVFSATIPLRMSPDVAQNGVAAGCNENFKHQLPPRGGLQMWGWPR